jgi:hypothetical protein
MAGLLDLIAARNPEQAGGLLSDLVAGPRNRLADYFNDRPRRPRVNHARKR